METRLYESLPASFLGHVSRASANPVGLTISSGFSWRSLAGCCRCYPMSLLLLPGTLSLESSPSPVWASPRSFCDPGQAQQSFPQQYAARESAGACISSINQHSLFPNTCDTPNMHRPSPIPLRIRKLTSGDQTLVDDNHQAIGLSENLIRRCSYTNPWKGGRRKVAAGGYGIGSNARRVTTCSGAMMRDAPDLPRGIWHTGCRPGLRGRSKSKIWLYAYSYAPNVLHSRATLHMRSERGV